MELKVHLNSIPSSEIDKEAAKETTRKILGPSIIDIGKECLSNDPKKTLTTNRRALRSTLQEFLDKQKQSFLKTMNDRVEHLKTVRQMP